jgi:hypothetical protein
MKKLLKNSDLWMAVVTIVSILGLNFLIFRGVDREKCLKTDVKQLQSTVDSLKQECLSKDIDLGRYEYSLEQLEDVNPQASQAFYEILSNAE